MPTTRAARAAAARAAARERNEQASLLCRLPLDVQASILYHLSLAHDIALAGLSSHSLSDAAKLALKARPFSHQVVTLRGHTGWVSGVVHTPDGRVITGSWDSTIKVWRDGACERTIHQAHHHVNQVKMLPNGGFVSLQEGNRTAKFWTSTCSLISTVNIAPEGHEQEREWPECIAALLNGTHFVVGYSSGVVNLFGMDGTLVRTIEGHSQHVVSLAAMLDGQRFLSGSDDKMIKLWDIHSEDSLIEWYAGGCIYALAVAPDGQRILSGDLDGTVKLWLLGEDLYSHGVRRVSTFSELHTNVVKALVALPDNQHALSASTDKTVKLFNFDGAVLRTFKHHTDDVTSLTLLPDGLRFVSGSDDRTARIAYHGLAPIRI